VKALSCGADRDLHNGLLNTTMPTLRKFSLPSVHVLDRQDVPAIQIGEGGLAGAYFPYDDLRITSYVGMV
jgi:hypothetical protein